MPTATPTKNSKSEESLQSAKVLKENEEKFEKLLDQDKLVQLYNQETISIPPKSAMYIPMEVKQKGILSDENSVIIFGDEHFQLKKQLI